MAVHEHRRILLLTTFICVLAVSHAWAPITISWRPPGGLLGHPEPPPGFRGYPEKYFYEQRLDHFEGSDARIWKQFVSDTFFKPGGPIFLMLGGEAALNPVWMVEGTWIKYAQMYSAVAVMLEHRYYGKSQPVPDLSVKNLRYLSSRQAIADAAYFLYNFKEDNRSYTNSKVIVFGGSYSGSLAAWLRSKYPYMVDGAVASSAPVVAKVEFKEYLEVVSASLDSTGPSCTVNIKNATSTMYDWCWQQEKRIVMKELFRLCDKIDHQNILDIAGLFSNLADNFVGVVQYNKDTRAFEGALGTNITIETVCNIMNDETRGHPIERYADVNTLLLETYSTPCLDFTYKKLLADMKQTEWTSRAAEGARQWFYQTCAEFGWYESTRSLKQPFGLYFTFPYNYSLDQCEDIYEDDFRYDPTWDNVEETNRYYGGKKLPGSNIVFINGAIDPWHAVGVTEDLSPDSPAIFMNDTAHCADMYPARDSDPADLVAARQKIAELIGKWLT